MVFKKQNLFKIKMNKLSLLSLNIVVVQPNHSINKINYLELRYFQTHRQFLRIVFNIRIFMVIKKIEANHKYFLVFTFIGNSYS